MARVLTGRVIVDGAAAGPVLASDTPLSLWGGLNPEHGMIIDRHHPLHGCFLKGHVLVLPAGRGSSSASTILLESIVKGTAPTGVLLGGVDEVMAMGAVVAEELFGQSIPVLTLDRHDFLFALRASFATIAQGGRVALEERRPSPPAARGS